MADKVPEFKPDIEAALRLTISALAQIASSLPHGVPRNLVLAQNLLDPPVPPDLPTETWGDKLIVTKTTPDKILVLPDHNEVVAETPTPAKYSSKGDC